MHNYEWNLNHLYESIEQWKKSAQSLQKKIEQFDMDLNNLTFCDHFTYLLENKIELDKGIEPIYCYPRRHLDLDATDVTMETYFNEAVSLYGKMQKLEKQFEDRVIENYDKITIPPFYQNYIDLIMEKKKCNVDKKALSLLESLLKEALSIKKKYHLLTGEELYFSPIINEKGEEMSLTLDNIEYMLSSANEYVRKNAFKSITKSFKELNSTLTDLYSQKVNMELKKAQAENYETVLERKLSLEKLPPESIDNLICEVHKNKKIVDKFLKCKKKILHKKIIHNYDLDYLPSYNNKEVFDIEEGIALVKHSLSMLGDEYSAKIDRAFKDGWIDVFPKEHKRKDSYSCISYYGVPYTSLNYQGTLKSVRVLAHELGHALHTDYAKKQDFIYFEYSTFLSEIASKVNELLFNHYLYQRASTSEEKICILGEEIKSLINTLFGQTMLTEFEKKVMHQVEEGTALTPDFLNTLYYELYTSYYGNEVICDEELKYMWSKIPHLFLYESYYVSSYVMGVAVASSIVEDILVTPSNASNYVQFLELGGSISIEEALQKIGIDIKEPDYINRAFCFLNEKVEAWHTLIKKKK